MDILDLAKRVKRGVRLLDKKVPNWRNVLRSHKDGFDLGCGDCCVLGTLEHFSAQMKALNRKRVAGMSDADYHRGVARLHAYFDGAEPAEFGFNTTDRDAGMDYGYAAMEALNDLWRAEFETV